MTKGNPAWERFEHHTQEILKLRGTPGSGNQWHDPSDGVSRVDDPYKVMVDCKYTDKASYSLSQAFLAQWWSKATMAGNRFALPVRFGGDLVYAEHRSAPKDWVVITLDDYAELVETAREKLSSVERADSDDISGQQHLQETG